MKNKLLISLSIVAVMCWAVVAFPSGAQATVTIFLDDHAGHTVQVADGGIGDLSSAAGVVTFSGALGVWDINVTTGFSSSPVPILDLSSIDRSTTNGQLTLKVSDVGFIVPNPTTAFSQVGGTTTGTVNFSNYFSSANTLFTQGGAIHTFTGLGPGGFGANAQDTLSTTSPFSFTEVVDIFHTSAGLTSFDAQTSVPLPPSALLLGSGLLGLVGLGWRRGKQ